MNKIDFLCDSIANKSAILYFKSVAHMEKGPAVVDDVVVVTTNIKDLKRVDEVSAKYEEQSGMMLSRTSKSKVMYLGSWKWRATRPRLPVGVEYLQEVKQLKVLGLTLSPCFKTTLRLTWEERISKLRTQCIQWSTRSLPTLHQRVQVINMYLATKIYYHARYFHCLASTCKSWSDK